MKNQWLFHLLRYKVAKIWARSNECWALSNEWWVVTMFLKSCEKVKKFHYKMPMSMVLDKNLRLKMNLKRMNGDEWIWIHFCSGLCWMKYIYYSLHYWWMTIGWDKKTQSFKIRIHVKYFRSKVNRHFKIWNLYIALWIHFKEGALSN